MPFLLPNQQRQSTLMAKLLNSSASCLLPVTDSNISSIITQQTDAKLADMFCMKFIKSSTSSSVLADGHFSNISWTASRKTTA